MTEDIDEQILINISISSGCLVEIMNLTYPSSIIGYTPFAIEYDVKNNGSTDYVWGALYNSDYSMKPYIPENGSDTYWYEQINSGATIHKKISFPTGLTNPTNNFRLRVGCYTEPMLTLYENYVYTGSDAKTFSATYFVGQTFKVDERRVLNKIQVRLARGGTNIGPIVLAIQATENGLPVGPDLATATIDGDLLPLYPNFSLVEFTPCIMLEPGASQLYAFTLKAPYTPEGSNAYITWDVSGAYTDGTYIYSQADVWNKIDANDLEFYEYSYPTAI